MHAACIQSYSKGWSTAQIVSTCFDLKNMDCPVIRAEIAQARPQGEVTGANRFHQDGPVTGANRFATVFAFLCFASSTFHAAVGPWNMRCDVALCN